MIDEEDICALRAISRLYRLGNPEWGPEKANQLAKDRVFHSRKPYDHGIQQLIKQENDRWHWVK